MPTFWDLRLVAAGFSSYYFTHSKQSPFLSYQVEDVFLLTYFYDDFEQRDVLWSMLASLQECAVGYPHELGRLHVLGSKYWDKFRGKSNGKRGIKLNRARAVIVDYLLARFGPGPIGIDWTQEHIPDFYELTVFADSRNLICGFSQEDVRKVLHGMRYYSRFGPTEPIAEKAYRRNLEELRRSIEESDRQLSTEGEEEDVGPQFEYLLGEILKNRLRTK